MQSAGKGSPPLGIIFDSAFGHRADDALALALLYHFDGKNEARILSLSVSSADLNAARMCAVISRFYRQAKDRDPLPIGLFTSAKLRDETPMTSVPLTKLTASGTPVYRHNIERITDTADPLPLMRNALASQPDQSVLVILTGPATNAARLLNLSGAKQLIARKVKSLIIATGSFSAAPESRPDLAIQADIEAMKKVFAEWPTSIFAAGSEVGESVLFPATSIEKDFAWSSAHPVADTYRAHKPVPYDAPTSGLAAALYAMKPEDSFFKVSVPGAIQVLDDGRTKFYPLAAEGKHYYLIVAPEKKESLLARYIELTSAKPIPPPTRR
jgi:inosine-uridine nucleoside N-ribohydrolase